ncbi:MAG: SHOCT domain-containing protein [Nitrospinae bacterium]|nr:SHOCT domain-containing protein [Nitrospinota bacterium]
MVLCSGLVSGCASTPEKSLKTEGFTLSYRDKNSANNKASSINKIKLHHPLKISESDVRSHLESLIFEEQSLFGKKKYVFNTEDIDRIARLLTKAFQHVPSHKIIHYELETSGRITEGDIFASKGSIHWRFNSIKGMGISVRSNRGNTKWKLALQPGQRYHQTTNLMGSRSQENWVITNLIPAKMKARPKQKAKGKTKAPSRAPAKNTDSPAKTSDPALEEKLQFLKDLHEKNLIDEKEYDQKRKELLDAYL